MNVEGRFSKALKLYHFWNKNFVTLGIKISEYHVITLYIGKDQFQKMISDSYEPGGYEDEEYLILVKEKYVKLSKMNKDTTHHFRLDPDHWIQLIEDYNNKIKTPEGECFCCEVG